MEEGGGGGGVEGGVVGGRRKPVGYGGSDTTQCGVGGRIKTRRDHTEEERVSLTFPY